ncbi:MAG: LutC/YkgG family protein [Marinilabiliaceae bacterium]
MTGKKSHNASRENILARLRKGGKAHSWHPDWPDSVPEGEVFPPVNDLLETFREEFTALGGTIFIEKDEEDLFTRLKDYSRERGWEELMVTDWQLRKKMDRYGISYRSFEVPVEDRGQAGVTTCESLVAQTGSVMVSSAGGSGRRMNVYMPVHVVLARRSQLVASIDEGFSAIQERYSQKPSQITLISGPSRTADIEKTLVMGAHGPGELIVMIDSMA